LEKHLAILHAEQDWQTEKPPNPAEMGTMKPHQRESARIQLQHRFAFRFSSIPGARGRPLLGPSPALIVVSVSTPRLMPPLRFFARKVLRLFIQKEERGNIWDGGGSSQCRRRLANPVALLAGAQAMVTFFNAFFEMTLNCFPQKLGPIKQHLKTR
jgi:hypothetical protein